MADTKYCLCCGDNVPFNYVERNERREITCAYCGFTLDVQTLWDPSKVSEGYALVADDSKYVRNIIVDALKASKFSANVIAVENGLELTTAFARLISERAAIDMAIIDLNMPIMDGITAARTIRAIESQHKISSTPVIFFSAEKANESLKEQMELLNPASYMNKGTDPDPDSLTKRVEQLVGYLMEKYKKSPR
jgi:CheY-like chemotaxis protein